MVDASGTLVDDGVAAKLSEQHYYYNDDSLTHRNQTVTLICGQLKLNVEIIDRTNSVEDFQPSGTQVQSTS